MKQAFAALGLLLVVGCGPTTREYQVVVRNDSYEPMTVVLTKDGGPMDMTWLAPEDLAALLKAPPEARVNGIVIKPGQTADQTRSSQFNADTNAVLRIYRGEQSPQTMVGISPGSPNREELLLAPGKNNVVIGANGKAVRQ